MARWILAVLAILVSSLAGIAVLALLLWWLLSRQKAEQAAAHIEIDEQPSAVDAEQAEVAAEAGPLALDVEVAEIEALEEQPAADVLVRDAEVGEPAPGIDMEAEALEEQPVVDVLVPDSDVGEPAPGIDMEAEARAEEAVPSVADELERIDGIGPKISSVLQAAGITTFATLAATDVSRLEEVLEAESPRLLRLADPATWPEQARLAAAGDWEGLEAFQSSLKGGRRR